MNRLGRFLSKIIRGAAVRLVANKRVRTYASVLLTTGLIGVSSIYLWPDINRTKFLTDIQPKLISSDKPSREHYNFIVKVTKKCMPSVVSIEIKNSNKLSPDSGEPMIASTGSGFVVDPNGWILTNAHVVINKPGSFVVVVMSTGESYTATVHDIDLKLDLALLKIPCTNLPPLKLGKSKDVLPGEWVVALGSPLSLRHTITAGVISSVDRDAHELGINSHSMKYIQTDAAITFGHSGGPLLNLDGEVIGINNLRITAGITFAIPVDYAKDFLSRSSMRSHGSAGKPPLAQPLQFGVTTLSLTNEVVKELLREQNVELPVETRGVLVWKVVKDSPAFKAGLVAGDVITHINNEPVFGVGHMYVKLTSFEKQTVTFSIYRQGLRTRLYLKVKDKIIN